MSSKESINRANRRRRIFSRILSSFLLIGSLSANAQNGQTFGFENNALNGWAGTATSESATVNATAATVRTGGYSLKLTTTGTSTGNKQWYSATPFAPTGSGTNVHFIYWAKAQDAGTSVDASFRYSSTTPPSGTGSSANASGTVPLSVSGWTRVTNSTNTNNVRYYYPGPRKTLSAGATSVFLDDGILYNATSLIPDTVKPSAPSAIAGLVNGNLVNLSWTSNTDPGTEASGVEATVLLRTTNLSAAAPVLNDQAAYSVVGGASGPNLVNDWTIISTITGPTAATFLDPTPVPGNYKYAVVLRDVAYNYSVAAVSGTIVAGNPVPTIYIDRAGFSSNLGTIEKGLSSLASMYQVRGFNLNAPVVITAPAGFEVSLTSGAGFTTSLSLPPTAGSLANTDIYVRYSPTAATGATGGLNITHVSGSSSVNVPVSGNAIDTEPATTGSISFNLVRSTRIEVNLPTIGSGGKRIIVMRPGNEVNFLPVDGVPVAGVNASFTAATDQGNSNKVVYDGNGSGSNVVLVTDLIPGTTYFFAVYEYNIGTGTSQNYLLSSPVTAIARTADNDLAISTAIGGGMIGVYPNPTSGIVYIDAPEHSITTVCDLAGHLMLSRKNAKSIDLKSLSGGMFYLSVYDEQGILLCRQPLVKY